MHLETMSRVTSVCAATVLVFRHQGSSHGRRRSPVSPPIVHVTPVFGAGDHFRVGIAEDSLQSLSSDPRSGLQSHASLAVSGRGIPGFDDNGYITRWDLVCGEASQ